MTPDAADIGVNCSLRIEFHFGTRLAPNFCPNLSVDARKRRGAGIAGPMNAVQWLGATDLGLRLSSRGAVM